MKGRPTKGAQMYSGNPNIRTLPVTATWSQRS
jgi:hypothetical protein